MVADPYTGKHPNGSPLAAGNPKDVAAQKAGKPDLSLNPPEGGRQQAFAQMDGARKYGPYNWRNDPIKVTVYVAAAKRHLDAIMDGEDVAADSGVDHFGHVMACAAIALDAKKHGTLIDDRVKKST